MSFTAPPGGWSSDHDGENAFTLKLELSEEVKPSYNVLQGEDGEAGALTGTGGSRAGLGDGWVRGGNVAPLDRRAYLGRGEGCLGVELRKLDARASPALDPQGHVRLWRWCQRWIERIAEIYRLNEARLKHYDRAHLLERQTPAFDAAQAELKKTVDELFADAEAERAGLTDRARRAKPLRSPLNRREGLCVFVDRPFVPMDNNRGDLSLRGPVIGRRLSFGSDCETGAGFTATMYSVAGTLAINCIDVWRWLKEWLTACAENTGKPPNDLTPWLPWSMSEERQRELTASG